ncbi:MAG: ATP phosphoribosyltransferase [Lachnospiraceae bacterium]|jgi:ATP phosphoribosyltransferase|nr:ATP phosphoribosyltransferase [Lachnospiraceae bacterium]
MLTIALPKGRLGEQVYALLKRAGYACSAMEDIGRKLVLEDTQAGLRFLLVKPVDVAVYVEKGAADLGVAGKDILVEKEADVYEMLDLGFGRCHMAVAAKEDYQEDFSRKLRVATKFENIARKHYARQGRDIELIHLNGSIELAPVLGLSDVIVDIVETGTTLKENHLAVIDRFMPISARVIVNKASYRFKQDRIDEVVNRLKEIECA